MAITIDDEMAVDMDNMDNMDSMDNIDNMDDLFGDGTGALLSEASQAPKEVFERIEELRSSSCHQSVTWSRQGCIASITSNGGLELQNLRIDPKDGSWGLSDPAPIPHVGTSNTRSVPLQHLCWSPNGLDLAAIDTAGRVAILTSVFLNKPVVVRNIMQDSIDELHAVVGSHWLNPMTINPRQPVLHNMAVKTSSQGYRYESVSANAFGPSYPINQTTRGKSALLCVTTAGLLRLFWIHENGTWRETTTEIESIVTSDDLITHASMCADKDRTLLLTYATSSKQLRVLRIAIHWAMPAMPNNKEQTPHPTLPLRPPTNATMEVTHLTSTNWMDVSSETKNSHLSSTTPALSHLRILSPCSSEQQGVLRLPTILTVRTHLPHNTPFYDEEVHSLIERWEVKPSNPQIHSAFQQLSARRDSVGSKKTTSPAETFFLKKMDGVSSKKVITWMETLQLDRILVMGHSDGSVEFVDRHSLEDISNKGGLDKFCHLRQVGFKISDVEPSLSGALSPSGLAVAYKTSEGKVKWKGLLYNYNDMGSPRADAHYTAFIAGLSMPAIKEVMINAPNDDVLAVASQFKGLQGRDLAYDLVSEISKNLKFHFDYSEEVHHESLINNNGIQLSLGLMLALGYNGEASQRGFSGTIAWMTLQLRYSVMMLSMLTHSVRVPVPGPIQKANVIEDAEALRLMVGTVRWSLDLISWIVDCLIHPNDPDEFDETFSRITKAEPLDLNVLNNYLYSTKNVALHLLLASTTRGFLISICRRLHHLDHTARSAMAAAANGHAPTSQMSSSLRASYTSIAHLTQSSIVPYPKFDRFVTKIAEHVRAAYVQAGLPGNDRNSASARNRIEQQILFGGGLPQQSAYAVSKIFHEDLPALKAEIDPANLFFHDFSVLGLPLQDRGTNLPYFESEDPVMKEKIRQKYVRYRVRHTVDVFQRKPLKLGNEPEPEQEGKQGRRFRRCARCAAVMEDMQSRNPCVAHLIGIERRCHCAGFWDIMTGKRCIP